MFGEHADRVALDAMGPDGNATIEREIVLTGDYKGNKKFQLTRRHLDQMIANYQRAGVDPALDREHESWFSFDPTGEARGWVKALRVEPSKLAPGRDALVGTIELNDLGRQAVANKHYRYLSGGINFKTIDRLTGVDLGASLDHVALVKHPYVQNMQPLTMSVGTEAGDEENTMKNLIPTVLLSLGLAADVDEEKALAAFNKREDERKALAGRVSTLEGELTIAKKAAGESEALSKRLKVLEAKDIVREVDEAVKAFKLDPSERDEWIELGGIDADRMRKMLSKRKATPPAGEIKLSDKPRGDETALAAQEKAVDDEMKADPSITVASAYARAEAKHPALFKRETEEA
jgi:hypothetical protein